MAHIRQRVDTNDRREHRQSGESGGDRRSSLEAAALSERILEELSRIADLTQAQHKRSRKFTSTFTGSITAAGSLFHGRLHLPEESAIAGAYIENNSTLATLTVFEGPGAGGRVIGIIAPNHSKRIALADHVSSLSITASVVDPGPALVIVTLSTQRFSPTYNALT